MTAADFFALFILWTLIALAAGIAIGKVIATADRQAAARRESMDRHPTSGRWVA